MLLFFRNFILNHYRWRQMLKRLSYPLVWMGESLSSEPKESSPVAAAAAAAAAASTDNQESVFSKVFSR